MNVDNFDALIIIDPQNDFFEGGSLSVPNSLTIIPAINQWIRVATNKDIPIIVTRDWHPANHCSFKAQGGPWPAHCVQHTEGAAFHPDLDIPENIIIVSKADTADKDAYSGFAGKLTDNSTIAAFCQKSNIERVAICGLALDYCVKATALDAAKCGLDVIISLEATKGITEESSKEVIDELIAASVSIVNSH